MTEQQTYHATQVGNYLDVCDGIITQQSKINDHTAVQELLDRAFLESYWYAVYHRRQYDHFTTLQNIDRG